MEKIPKPDRFTTCHPDMVRGLLGLSQRQELSLRSVVREVYKQEMGDKLVDPGYDVRWGNLQITQQPFVADMIEKASSQIKNNTDLEQETKDVISRAEWYIEWALGLYHKGRKPKKAVIGGSARAGETRAEAGAEAGTEAVAEAGREAGREAGAEAEAEDLRVVYRPWEW
ncbi:hypothetical protein DFP73DRAFT_554484 [Morchella snyderi]|nr:hypothetical protein DFP73DRAFT_554484 [Morchella snyderi]